MTKLDTHQRILVPVSFIQEGNRVRGDYGDLQGLANSISEHGLLHPPVINTAGILIAGGRRFRAMRDLLKWTEIPINYFEFADEITLRILEREENVRRKAMTWQEEVLSIAAVHEHHSLNASLKGERWIQSATGELLGMSRAHITYSIQLAGYIRKGDKEIMGCLRMWDAIHLNIKRQAEESNKLLAKATIPKQDISAAQRVLDAPLGDDESVLFAPVGDNGQATGGVSGLSDDGEMPGATSDKIIIPLSKMILRGDAIDILESLPAESVDHVITDWPYGINIDMLDQSNPHGGMKNIETVKVEHDEYANKELQRVILPLIFRVLKPNGFFVTFMDYMLWNETYDLAIDAGFKVQRWPYVWLKTSRCMNQSASYNLTKTSEPAIVCRKGNATLVRPGANSHFIGGNDQEEKLLGHPFAKPFAMWQDLYADFTIRGQVVLDPFAGRGSSTIAAVMYGLSPIAIEIQEAHHNALVVNVAEHYKKSLRNVEFI